MAKISRTGITNGQTLDASHITNIIDALDGTSTTTTVVATGSFSGSFVGSFSGSINGTISSTTSASYALTSSHAARATSASFATAATTSISASIATTASFVLNAVSSSFATTASFLLGAISSSISSSYATRASSSFIIRTSTNATFYPMLVNASPVSYITASAFTPGIISMNPSIGRITAINFTGSLLGTASSAVSSSIAQKGGDDQATLTFIHLPVGNLLIANADTIGGYPIDPVHSGETRIGLHMPFTGLIVSASYNSYCETPGSTGEKVNLRLLIDGVSTTSLGFAYVDNYLDSGSVAVNIQATKGQRLAIRLEPQSDGTAVGWTTNTILTVRKY